MGASSSRRARGREPHRAPGAQTGAQQRCQQPCSSVSVLQAQLRCKQGGRRASRQGRLPTLAGTHSQGWARACALRCAPAGPLLLGGLGLGGLLGLGRLLGLGGLGRGRLLGSRLGCRGLLHRALLLQERGERGGGGEARRLVSAGQGAPQGPWGAAGQQGSAGSAAGRWQGSASAAAGRSRRLLSHLHCLDSCGRRRGGSRLGSSHLLGSNLLGGHLRAVGAGS